MIYLDHAATTPIDPQVIEEMTRVMHELFANPSSLHGPGMAAQRYIQSCRKEIASLLHVHPSEIYFTSGGTEANNWALKGALLNKNKSAGLAISAIEHSSIQETAHYLKSLGHPLTIIPVESNGLINLAVLDQLLNSSIKIVSIIGANNEIGVIQPIQEIARIVHAHGAILHVDAVQLIGQVPFSIENCGADLVTFTAHKFYGPKGIGALYIRKGLELQNLIHGGNQENGHRAGTESAFLIGGMTVALRLAIQRVYDYEMRCRTLTLHAWQQLKNAFPTIILNGPPIGPTRLPANLNISFPNKDGHELVFLLQNEGIAISTGSACHADSIVASHVITALHQDPNYALGTLRITVGHQTTISDLDTLVTQLRKFID